MSVTETKQIRIGVVDSALESEERLFATYRAVHEQGFLPIFTGLSANDPRVLVEGCVAAGCRVIEYTLGQSTNTAKGEPLVLAGDIRLEPKTK